MPNHTCLHSLAVLCSLALAASAADRRLFVATDAMHLAPMEMAPKLPVQKLVRHYTFDRDVEGWRAHKGMAVASEAGALGCRGRNAGNYNYCASPRTKVESGKYYRMSVRIKVIHRGPAAPEPCMKVEFMGKGSGRVNTSRWHADGADDWQQLEGIVQMPKWCESVWFAIEKPGKPTCTIDFLIDDVRLDLLDTKEAESLDRRRLESAQLKGPVLDMAGKHPLLYMTDELLLRGREHKGPYEPIVKTILAIADKGVRWGPPVYEKRIKREPNDEQLWQRGVGNMIPHLALAYRLTGEREYLDSAAAWMLAACSYKTWGLRRVDGMDLATGHQLTGLGLGYDWLYQDLTDEQRTTIRAGMVRRAGAMARALMHRRVWWHGAYLQNHQWVNCTGLLTAGLAIWDEVPEAKGWVALAHETFLKALEMMGHDGASHEGEPYWEYGIEYILRWATLAKSMLGVDVFPHSPWLRNTTTYCLHMTLPRGAWKGRLCVFDFADAPRTHWYGPDYMLRCLAAQYRDGRAQWLAARKEEARVCSTSSGSYLNLFWFDPTVPETPPDDQPPLHWFKDMGYVCARSDWGPDASALAVRCGPPLGHRVQREIKKQMGDGHVHPDCGGPLFFAHGEFLLRDDGYMRPHSTGNHSCLLIDGRGQKHKSLFMAPPYGPTVLRADSTAKWDLIVCDLAPAYDTDLGLKTYRRALLFLKPGVLVVADRVDAERDLDLEWRWQTEGMPVGKGTAFAARGKRAQLDVRLLLPNGASVKPIAPAVGRYADRRKPKPALSVKAARKMRSARMLTVFVGQPVDAASPVSASVDNGTLRVRAGQRKWDVALDWATPALLRDEP